MYPELTIGDGLNCIEEWTWRLVLMMVRWMPTMNFKLAEGMCNQLLAIVEYHKDVYG